MTSFNTLMHVLLDLFSLPEYTFFMPQCDGLIAYAVLVPASVSAAAPWP